jgi:ectoine hydroxylase-related dioxygenase (phytanoyl-CoA dioxygenase family)
MDMVFKDIQIQNEFEKEGYVVVDFLSNKDAKSLLVKYEELAAQNTNCSSSSIQSHETEISILSKNKKFAKAVQQEIVETFKEGTDQLLNDYAPVFGNMIYKNPGETKDLGLHQDWCFSDPRNTIVNVWCPLVDTNEHNGTLQIINRSHLFQKGTIRGANIEDAANKISDFIKEHFATSLSLKAGQAVIFNTQLFHFSPPNLSKLARPAAVLTMLPKKEEMNFYFKNPATENGKNEIEKYIIDSDFMTSFQMDHSVDYFTEKSFIDLYQKYNQELPESLRYRNGKRIVFKNEKQHEQFEKEGYVTIDLLSTDQVESLLSRYKELNAQNKKRSDSPINSHETEISIFNKDKSFTKAVHQEIVETFKEKTDELLNDYAPIMGNMVYKNPMETKDFSLHQDWRFSDETKHTSINIWCPLLDTNLENGTLHIINRSHLFQAETIRGANIGDASNKISGYIKEHFGTTLPLKVGQAIILNTQLYHFSPPNRSSLGRPVALLAMLPKEAEMFFYYQNPESGKSQSAIEKYEIDEDFMTSFHVDGAPQGVKKVDTFDYNIDYFTENSFTELYKKYNHILPLKPRISYFFSNILKRKKG